MKYATLLFTLLITGLAFGQTPQKIGYADVDYIFGNMPESKTIEADLKTFAAQLQKQIDTKSDEYKTKVAEFQAYGATVPDAVKQNTQRELVQLQQNIGKLQEDSQNDLGKRQASLMDPIYAKVSKAIEDVGNENGFDIILNAQIQQQDIVLWGKKEVDISDLVLKKLGVTAPATPAPAK